jgi:hypothetical protein
LPYTIKAAQVSINTIQPSEEGDGYIAEWKERLHSLGVTSLRLQTGGTGVTLGLSPVTYPATWDTNLEWLLTHITGLDKDGVGTPTGFKCWFQSLGDPYGGHFGINDLNQDSPPIPIVAAKAIIDKLAGDNSLSHNFITDTRILFWSVGNECTVSVGGVPNALYYFLIDLMGYIHDKGGVVIANSPAVDDTLYDFAASVPLFEGHADYMELHAYHVWELIHHYSLGGSNYNWDAWQTALQTYLEAQIANRGTFAINKLILGEFGMWYGYSPEWDGATFTNQNRIDYYSHYFAALTASGFINVAFFSATWAGIYYMISEDGTLLPGCNEIIKAYVTEPDPDPVTLPWTADFTDASQFTVQSGTWGVAP